METDEAETSREAVSTEGGHWLEWCGSSSLVELWVVQITVHDSKVVQVEKTEKIRVSNQRPRQRYSQGE